MIPLSQPQLLQTAYLVYKSAPYGIAFCYQVHDDNVEWHSLGQGVRIHTPLKEGACFYKGGFCWFSKEKAAFDLEKAKIEALKKDEEPK